MIFGFLSLFYFFNNLKIVKYIDVMYIYICFINKNTYHPIILKLSTYIFNFILLA